MTTYTKSKVTQQTLILAAGELFTELGVDAVSTRVIAQKANENAGSIHYHFGGKEGLFNAVLDYATEPIRSLPLDDYLEANEGLFDTVAGQVQLVCQVVHHHFALIHGPDRPEWCCRLLNRLMVNPNQQSRTLWEELFRPHIKSLSQMAQRIRPQWNEQRAAIWAILLPAQVSHFSTMKATLVPLFELNDDYPPEFLQSVEEQIARNTLLSLGLPCEVD